MSFDPTFEHWLERKLDYLKAVVSDEPFFKEYISGHGDSDPKPHVDKEVDTLNVGEDVILFQVNSQTHSVMPRESPRPSIFKGKAAKADDFREKSTRFKDPQRPSKMEGIVDPIYRPNKNKNATRGNSRRNADMYHLVWDEDGFDSEHDSIEDLSPKERVDRILRETELSDPGPLSSADSGVPEPDFTFDTQSLEDDEIFTLSTSSYDEVTANINNNRIYTGKHSSSNEDNIYGSSRSNTVLDHDNKSSAKGISTTAGRVQLDLDSATPNLTSDNDYIENSFIEISYPPKTSPSVYHPVYGKADEGSKKSAGGTGTHDLKEKGKDFAGITVSFHKCNLNQHQEDSYIDDDMADSGAYVPESPPPNNLDQLPAVHTKPKSRGTEIRSSRAEVIYSDDPHTKDVVLPMHLPEMTMEESEEEAMLRAQSEPPGVDSKDTSPIVTVDQTVLSEKWQQRKKKVTIAIGVVSVLVASAAFGVIVYLVVHFLMELD